MGPRRHPCSTVPALPIDPARGEGSWALLGVSERSLQYGYCMPIQLIRTSPTVLKPNYRGAPCALWHGKSAQLVRTNGKCTAIVSGRLLVARPQATSVVTVPHTHLYLAPPLAHPLARPFSKFRCGRLASDLAGKHTVDLYTYKIYILININKYINTTTCQPPRRPPPLPLC